MENITLPIEFQEKMKSILGNDYDAFINSFNEPQSKAVHLNTNYISTDEFEKLYSNDFSKIPYCDNGYYSNIEKIGSSPLFHSGIIYSQDPGAMMPISALPFEFDDNDVVLDLCASPGGKSSQLAIKLSSTNGLLVSNEPVKNRNKILRSNMERMSYLNQSTLCMEPAGISDAFPGVFSFILIDAPCSGEGMFRKYPESINEWSVSNVSMCAQRQKEIIDDIIPALKPGGYILYSTCTYSPEEDEEIAKYIINNYNFTEIDFLPQIYKYGTVSTEKIGLHFYPHKAKGEGQYMCLLKNNDDLIKEKRQFLNDLKPVNNQIKKLIEESLKGNPELLSLNYCMKNNRIIIPPSEYMPYSQTGSLSYGILAGDIEKNRFIPHHQLFKIYGNLFSNKLDLTNDITLINEYLKGAEINSPDIPNGYGVITYQNAPIGGYKSSNGRLKNHYPKGLRNM